MNFSREAFSNGADLCIAQSPKPKALSGDDLRLDALDASLEMFIRAILNGMAFFILCTLYVVCLLYSFVIRNVMIVASRSLRLRPDQRQDHKHPSDPWLCI